MPIDMLDLMHQFHLVFAQFFAQLLQSDQLIFTIQIVLFASLRFLLFQIVQFFAQRFVGALNFTTIIQCGIRFVEHIYLWVRGMAMGMEKNNFVDILLVNMHGDDNTLL